MKKFSIMFACFVAALGFVACEDDKDPVYQVPTEFVLNTPATANQFYELNDEGTITLTCSQPDYGFAAVTNYSVEVSLTPDFAEVNTFEPQNATSTVLVLPMKRVAQAINDLRGIKTIGDYTPEGPRSIYIRAIASLTGVESSVIKSNGVELKNVQTYATVREPGIIYLVGQPSGWQEPAAGNAAHYVDNGWVLSEAADGIDSKIYYGTFTINPGEFQFRFYTELTGWDGGASIGSQTDDNPVDIELIGGTYSGKVSVPGKGSWQVPNFEGGTVNMTVNLNDKTVYFEVVSE